MAKHPRQAIRDAVKAALLYKTSAAERVYPGRVMPWKVAEMPGIGIFTPAEPVESLDMSGARDRTLTVTVSALVSLAEFIDDATKDGLAKVDSICAEIEAALDAAETLGGLALSVNLKDTQTQVGVEESGRPLGEAVLTYEIRYLTGEE